ncbi:hypothetical protein NMP99_15710 [Glutamicibacter mishrai]|uniref:EcoRII N-terminal effector-binding domain-containing protein n=1 Tax=Glutamicibacter mishrai TaxID=1775880 RepID=UPI0020CFC7F8|nr:EcoRII N-terminal effector-binding domain-containing protein [Glutamicibacter mishrai]UTT39437.1 hypothetical protein NMP99_15710 [Glutamicibacter mishrai]
MTDQGAKNFVRKTLSANDLGRTGGHQAGIAIPKSGHILSFFPRLSPEEYNPDCIINCFIPELEMYINLRYVYYNNKLHTQGTRNEYRITGTTRLLRQLNAQVQDEIEFTKDKFGEMSINIIRWAADRKAENTQIKLSNGWSFSVEGD